MVLPENRRYFSDDIEGIMYSISDKVIEAFGVTIQLYIVRYLTQRLMCYEIQLFTDFQR